MQHVLIEDNCARNASGYRRRLTKHWYINNWILVRRHEDDQTPCHHWLDGSS
jgi:hypothetical protein